MRQLWRQFAVAVGALLPFGLPAVSYGWVTQSDQQIVDGFYPASLVSAANSSNPGAPFNKISCFARLDRDTIVAGYSNDTLGAILLLKGNDKQQFKRVFQVSGLDLGGTNCSVTPVRLSGHWPDELLISFAAASGNSMDWVFEEKNDTLVSIGPTTSGRKGLGETQLVNSEAVNFYRDGSLQLVSGSEYPPPADGSAPTDGMSLYRLKDESLQLVDNVSLVFEAEIDEASKAPLVGHFQTPQSLTAPFYLRVVNGDRHGDHRSGGGEILINGKQVASLDRGKDILEVIVYLQPENTIEIRSRCGPGENFFVAIESNSQAGKSSMLVPADF